MNIITLHNFVSFIVTFANKFVLNSGNLKKFLHKIIQNDEGYKCRRSLVNIFEINFNLIINLTGHTLFIINK